MKTWKTLRRETLLDLGWRLRVEKHAVELHDGRVIDDWSWVVTPPYANVIAVTPDGTFVAFRQTKYSTGETLAPVGGHIEPGETPLQAAQRELGEEAGYQAGRLEAVSTYYTSKSVCDETAYIYLGYDLTQNDLPPDDTEFFEIATFSFDDVLHMVRASEIRDGMTVTAVLHAALKRLTDQAKS